MKKTRENSIVFYVVSNMDATLDAYNVAIINATTELHYNDLENVTYQTLHDDRFETMGGNHCGMFKEINEVPFWVLPAPVEMNLTVNEGSTDITKYTYNEYKTLIWDDPKEEEETL